MAMWDFQIRPPAGLRTTYLEDLNVLAKCLISVNYRAVAFFFSFAFFS